MEELYKTLFGEHCKIVPTITQLQFIAAQQSMKFEQFQQTTNWPASTGNLILHAVDQGVHNMFK